MSSASSSNRTRRRLIGKWIGGLFAGTLIIAVTSPWFVRSYVPLQVDPIRGVWTLPPGHVYRWRSEGYADTYIGPLGMPGRRSLAPDRQPPADSELSMPKGSVFPIALWGDSQAEGVCVDDAGKLHAQMQRYSDPSCVVYPLARSGEDAAIWLTQMPAVERELGVKTHVILVVDLPDLLAAPRAPLPPVEPDQGMRAQRSIAAVLPAFVIQAARHLLTESDGQTRRKLRFSVGPVANVSVPSASASASTRADPWLEVMGAIRETTRRPVVIVYAPHTPQIIAGEVHWEDPSTADLRAMGAAAQQAGIVVVDMSRRFRQAVRSGNWPRGFHNGLIGSGHLNEFGYRIIAERLAEVVRPIAPAIAESGFDAIRTAGTLESSERVRTFDKLEEK